MVVSCPLTSTSHHLCLSAYPSLPQNLGRAFSKILGHQNDVMLIYVDDSLNYDSIENLCHESFMSLLPRTVETISPPRAQK